MVTDNNPKTVPDTGETDTTAVKNKPVDVNAPLSLEEAQAVLDAEEGEIEVEIKKQKFKKDTDIAPDLKELKKEQDKKKQEVKQKKEEVKEAVKVEKEKTVIPSKFEGKTEEERLKIYQDMEASFTKKSQKVAELEAKITEYSTIDKKIEEYEKTAVVNQQKATTVTLPLYPTKELFYEDPEKYNQQVKEYYDAKLNAMVTPLYGQNWNQQRQNIVDKLKEVTEKDIVPYKDVEKEVEVRLKRNPALINQHGLNAREYVYGQIRNEMLPQKIEDIETAALEKAKRELQEESKEMSESQIMSSDITTQRRESKPVDLTQQLNDGVDPEKVIDAYKKKYKIDQDI